jgi:Glu-tRNA(Gln) amidotransferase subunit E-like FAD-binding protein
MKKSCVLKVALIIVSLLSYVQLYSQTNTNISNNETNLISNVKNSDLTEDEKTAYLINLCKEVENTYEDLVSDTRLKIALTSDVCEIVKQKRDKSETVLYKYNENVTLKIYSEDKIKK